MGDMSGSVSRPPRCCAWTRLAPARVDSAGLGHQWPPPMLPCDPINHGCVRRAGEAECQNVQAQRRKPASRARHARKEDDGYTLRNRCALRVCKFRSIIGGSLATASGYFVRHAASGLGSRARRAGPRRWAGTAPRASGPAPAAARRLPTHDPPCGARASDAPVEPQSGAPVAAVPGGARGLAHAHADGHGGASRRRWRRHRAAHRGTRRLRLASLRLTDLRQRGLHRAATL